MTTPAQDRDQRAALSAPIAPSTSSAPREPRREARPAAGAELLPCPFCGSLRAEVCTLDSAAFWVECCGCDASGSAVRTEAAAVAAWNRAPRPETAAEATRERSHAVRDRRRLRRARRARG